ncbi:MAG: 2-hydroxyacid dehydrogenase [Hyphomicrobiaceae bacterium]
MPNPPLLMNAQIMPMIHRQLEAAFDVANAFDPATREQVIAEAGPRVEVLATGGHHYMVDRALIDRLPKLRIVSNFGVGYDGVDAAYCASKGIVVTNTPDVLTEEVADTALGLLLMTVRELPQSEQYLRAGRWAKEGDYPLTKGSLRDRKVGMVGYGRIGQAIAKRIEAFGVPVSYFARSKRDVPNTFYSDLVTMARDVDTLVIITPGGAGTKNLVNAEVLKALGPRGVVINIARGTVVDETALKAALRDGTIHAAGLDVMWGEPKIDPDLMTIPNLVLLPHVGSASVWTRDKMGQLVVDNALSWKTKTPPLTPVPETPFKGW